MTKHMARHVADYIRQELDARGGVDQEMAEHLGKAFGVSSELFINLDKAYRLADSCINPFCVLCEGFKDDE